MSARIVMPVAIPDDWRTVYLVENVGQLLALIRRAHSVRVNTSHNASIIGDPDHCDAGRFRGTVSLSKTDAKRYAEELLGDTHMTGKDGHKLALCVYTSVYLRRGRYDLNTGQNRPDKKHITLWIG